MLLTRKKQNNYRIFIYFTFFLVLYLIISLSAYAKSVQLEWDVNEDADYYIVYWGVSAGSPSNNSGNIGIVTAFSTIIPDDKDYYFAVKAYNACGNSSDYSDWIVAQATEDESPSPDIAPTPDVTPTPDVVPTSDITPVIGPEPETLSSIITDPDNYPSIEVFNKKFEHLEWLTTGWADYNELSGVAHVATGDISNNGENEIIIGLGQVESEDQIPGGYFEVVGADYSHLAWGRVQWPEYNLTNGETWPTCGDIDGDGVDEIIVGLGIGGQGYFEVFKYIAGDIVHFAWVHIEWSEYNDLVGETRPVCADVDGDGADEIIVGLGSKGGSADVPAGRFEVFDNDLTHLSWCSVNWLEYNSVNGETWPAAGDVDGDGNVEIIAGLGAGGDGRMALFDFDVWTGVQSEWVNVDWNEYNAVSGETRPVCGDIDNDLKDEIIVGFGPVSQEANIPEGYFTVIDDDFTLMEWGQINNSDFNKLNGASVPSKGTIDDGDKIIIGLGSWDFVKKGDDLNVDTISNNVNASSSGCFIDSISGY